MLIRFVLLLAPFVLVTEALAVVIPTVLVGDVGNVADSQGRGSVSYLYRIGATEVTNAQYAEFLNAKASSDPLSLYHENMGDNFRGGIIRSGNSGSYTYAPKPDMGNKPVNYVNWFDAVRFVNWMHNHQGSGDTENGAYTLVGNSVLPINAPSIVRNSSARWFLPSDNEWHKAAYFQPATAGGDSDSYWLYPTASNSLPIPATAIDTAGPTRGDIANPGANVVNHLNSADWNSLNGNVTTVGSAGPLSQSYYGTYDQAGNVGEWNENLFFSEARGLSGGAFSNNADQFHSGVQGFNVPQINSVGGGFRVATIPEPSTVALAAVGLIAVAGIAMRRARRSGI